MLIGHIEQSAAFREAVVSGRLHHAWLLAGPRGIGKAHFARTAAAWLLARAAYGDVDDKDFAIDPGHPTARLLAAGSHIDFRVVELQENPKTNKMRPGIAVDQFVKADTSIGEPLASIFRTRPALSDWRVIVIDSVDDLNRNAANAFLKHLEEPPSNTLFLAVSHAPSRLLPTLRSRCRTLRFHPLGDDDVEAVLATKLIGAPIEVVQALREVAGGSPGRAVRLAEADIAGLQSVLESLSRSTPGEGIPQALALARSLASKAATARYEAFLDLVPAFLARSAHNFAGMRLGHAIGLWETASTLAASAILLSLDPQSVTFRLAGLVTELSLVRSGRHEVV